MKASMAAISPSRARRRASQTLSSGTLSADRGLHKPSETVIVIGIGWMPLLDLIGQRPVVRGLVGRIEEKLQGADRRAVDPYPRLGSDFGLGRLTQELHGCELGQAYELGRLQMRGSAKSGCTAVPAACSSGVFSLAVVATIGG